MMLIWINPSKARPRLKCWVFAAIDFGVDFLHAKSCWAAKKFRDLLSFKLYGIVLKGLLKRGLKWP